MQLCNQLKRNLFTLLAAVVVLSAWTQTTHAMQQQTADLYLAYVTGDDLYVRSGAGSTYYPFGKVNEGDIISIVGERFGWARVLTKGYAFHSFYGYVEVEDISLNEAETGGITLGKVDVLAPNLNRGGDPAGSWKWISRLPAESKVEIVGIEKSVAQDYYKIVLPEVGIGWISAQFVRPATTSELEDWNLHVARALKGEGADAELIEEATTEIAKLNNEAAENAAADTTQEQIVPATTDATAQPEIQETLVADNTSTEEATDADATETIAANDVAADTTEVATDDVTATNPPLGNTEETITQSTNETNTTTENVKLTAAEILGKLTIDDLEDSYDTLRREPVRNAEIEPLRQRYLAILELSPDEKRTVAIAGGRIKLLEARLELQKQLHNLDRVRKIAVLTDQDARASRIAVEKAADYAAVGRVTPSTIYNGKRLPLLLRLTDAATGRTVAYLEPDATKYDFTTLIGELIGVVGKKAYDGSLRLNIITPTRIDVLTPTVDEE